MEQARYWMWIERKQCLRSHVQTPTNLLDKSWEEQAFAEDSTGPLGGCIWPPRSYSCSFCRRDFRSAQALGGHMNVHRRERARLKQSPNPHIEVLRHHHNHQSPCTSVGAQHQPQVCTLVNDPNPNSNPSTFPSPLSRSTVSVLSKENCSDQTLVFLSYPPSIVQEHPKGPLFSDSNSDQIEGEKDPRIQDEGCRVQGDYLKHDLAVSLDLVLRQNRPSSSGGDEEAAFSGKRRRSDASSLPFFLKPSLFDRHHIQSDLPGYCPSSVEDIDLELRLGDRPKVK